MDAKFGAKVEANMDAKLGVKVESKHGAKVEAKHGAKQEVKHGVTIGFESKHIPFLGVILGSKLGSIPSAKRGAKDSVKLDDKLGAKPGNNQVCFIEMQFSARIGPKANCRKNTLKRMLNQALIAYFCCSVDKSGVCKMVFSLPPLG